MPNYKVTIEQINNVLPQTQCRDCGYQGCLPYAEAIVNNNENIDRCLPGGIKTLIQLGNLLEQNVSSLLENMGKKAKKPMLASIRETECIGCTKCIQACPVDAIIGSAKQLHSVLNTECTGCGLCVAPCPIDCIDLQALEAPLYDPVKAKQRYESRNKRLAENFSSPSPFKQKKTIEENINDDANGEYQNKMSEKALKKATILAAVARVKKKLNRSRS